MAPADAAAAAAATAAECTLWLLPTSSSSSPPCTLSAPALSACSRRLVAAGAPSSHPLASPFFLRGYSALCAVHTPLSPVRPRGCTRAGTRRASGEVYTFHYLSSHSVECRAVAGLRGDHGRGLQRLFIYYIICRAKTTLSCLRVGTRVPSNHQRPSRRTRTSWSRTATHIAHNLVIIPAATTVVPVSSARVPHAVNLEQRSESSSANRVQRATAAALRGQERHLKHDPNGSLALDFE